MKWVRMSLILLVAVSCLTGTAVASSELDGTVARPSPAVDRPHATAGNDGSDLTFTFNGDPDDVIDGNRGGQTPPAIDDSVSAMRARIWLQEVLEHLLRGIALLP